MQIEVPLIFYFPPSERDSERDGQAKAFVYGVRDDPNDPACQLMEILVNTGHDVSARDLRLEVDGDRLIVFADVSSRPGGINKERKVIRRFAMPPTADKDRISSKLGRDGRLSILIPIRKDVGRIQ